MSSTEDLVIVEEIALFLRGDESFSRLFKSILAAQESGETLRPLIMLSVETGNIFTRATRKGHLVFDMRSRSGDESEYREHQIRVSALTEKLLGKVMATSTETRASGVAAKSALKEALAEGNRVEILDYAQIQPAQIDTDGEDLRTVIRLDAFWKLLPVA